jgi:DNA helicase-2/ATP-dependent DNA helicase PcrA
MNLLSNLNPQQQEAVTHIEGPLLVLAGAGSGKTRVITRRVAYLIEQGVPSRNVLAITFTNKAAGEMKERIAQLVPDSRAWVGTFHKWCARTLRIYGEQAGLADGFTIYDTDDRRKVVREAISKLNLDKSQWPAESIEPTISRAKNELLDAESYTRKSLDYYEHSVAQIYRAYEELMRKANAVDFDDLLMRVAVLLRDRPELRADLDERYRFVLVDEYQDTNLAQYAILRALSQEHPNLCATGDPDQSIYGWRGANIGNILQFEADFPGTRVVRLETNYRSTKRILAAANHLIRFNEKRKPKDLVTDNPEGLPVQVVLCADERDEARSIASRVRQAVEDGRRRYSDFAVFCRIAALTRGLEMAFVAEGVPYQICSGLSFYERAEVKDLLAYLKLLVNPADDVAFARVVNVPSRGVGKSTLERLAIEAERDGRSLLETARDAARIAAIKPRQAQAIRGFVQLIDGLAGLNGHCVVEIMRQVLERTKYFDAEHATAETDERRANVEELLTAAHQFDESQPGAGLVEFLSECVLTTDLDAWDAARETVSVMTLHAAKGLEFPVVSIIAIEDGIMPHSRSKDDPNQLEEERRLMFVGMTRAREELHLSRAYVREFRGQTQMAIPSPFLSELPPEPKPAKERAAAPRTRLVTAAELAGHTPPAAAPVGSLSEGMLVRHPAYGLGRIAGLSGSGEQLKARVRFSTGDTRTFVVTKSPLRPVKAG